MPFLSPDDASVAPPNSVHPPAAAPDRSRTLPLLYFYAALKQDKSCVSGVKRCVTEDAPKEF